MVANHSIKVNGKWYRAGEEISSAEPLKKEQEQEQKQYTKTDINRMSTAELQTLAAEVGIDNAFDTSGGELKKLLIENFGLQQVKAMELKDTVEMMNSEDYKERFKAEYQ